MERKQVTLWAAALIQKRHVCVCPCGKKRCVVLAVILTDPRSRSTSWSQSDPPVREGIWFRCLRKGESVRSDEHVSQQRLTFVFNVLSHRKQQGRWPPCGAEREVLVSSFSWRPSARPLRSVTMMQHTLRQFGQLPFLTPFTGTKSVSKWTEQILREVDREKYVTFSGTV